MAFSLGRSSDSLDWFCYMADIVVDVITRNVSESLQKKKKKNTGKQMIYSGTPALNSLLTRIILTPTGGLTWI